MIGIARTICACIAGAALAGMLLYAVFQSVLRFLPAPSFPLALHENASVETRSAPEPASDRINLNTADLDTLTLLPGIGEKTAEAILALRKEIDGIRYPEDLLLIKGIGAKKLESIYDLVYAGPTEEVKEIE